VPLLVWRSLLPGCIELGCRKSFSDVAETTADYLMKGHPAWGTSFLPQIL
jgi:phosphopentomutase